MNTLFILPLDPSSVATFMAPVVGQRVLMLTPDADTAVMIASAIGRDDVLAATSVGRASRVEPPAIVIGPPEIIMGLMARSRLKLDGVTALVLAWVGASPALEAVLVDVPKDADRTVVASSLTPEVEALVERYARRARRVAGAPPAASLPAMRYVTVTNDTRASTLRRLLDDLDPPSAIIWTRTDASLGQARDLIRALGYAGPVQVARDAIAESAALVVLYDVPLDAAEMTMIVKSAPVQIVALAERAELARLPGATPLTLSGPLDRARQRLEELRRVLEAGVPAAELTWLQPLLDSYDGIEIAAAAIHLLERQRRAPAPAPPPPTPEGPRRPEPRRPETTNPRRPGTSGEGRRSGRR